MLLYIGDLRLGSSNFNLMDLSSSFSKNEQKKPLSGWALSFCFEYRGADLGVLLSGIQDTKGKLYRWLLWLWSSLSIEILWLLRW